VRLDLQSDLPRAPILVTLSRRNLLTLLAKPEQPGSACAISENVYVNGEPFLGFAFRVHSEPDEVQYEGRPAPGPMHLVTEEIVHSMTYEGVPLEDRRRAGEENA
jgi:hypothetical protein